MVAWKIVAPANEVEVTFDVEDEVAWQTFKTSGYGVAALQNLPMRLQVSGNVLKALPSVEIDTLEVKKRRHLSLPELYYAVAIDGVLRVNKPLRQLWERLKSSSATFPRTFVVYQHFRRRGWIPKPGLNYGARYVLYRGPAAEFHSEYVVYVQDDGETSSWNQIQSLTRIAADVKKTVLLCTVTNEKATADASIENDVRSTVNSPAAGDNDLTFGTYSFHGIRYTVRAIAIRFWDATIANEPRSYTFLPQPILPKKIESTKNRTAKVPLRREDQEV
ncbi:unnamed protein product [Peronospora destructor]|uniref:tRNA-intron lyase n=1 Tax=Peronospora destructor TaxID=86335 RepID=A0AAV0UIW2_9STRA|nr:unnamed protein product [Peronospora destructor]